MTKTCPRCGLTKERSEFYQNNSHRDGLQGMCKSCRKEYSQTEAVKEAHRRAATKYQQTEAGKEVYRRYTQTEAGKESRRKAVARYIKAFPKRKKAISAVNNALRDGRLFKKPCPCGAIKVQAHHEDYSKPLEVKWFCKKCHAHEHKKKEWVIV